ncbi:MAG: ATP-dependent helicase RecQ, partial [Mycobacterium sp.]|nr:ATP-dependent helicase RecQ [Mycobacterium sp.]
MSYIPFSEIVKADRRLARRLASSDDPSSFELVPMIRAYLVARGYQAVQFDGDSEALFGSAVWTEHGFRHLDGNVWKAEPWLPQWLDPLGVAPDYALANRANRRPIWSSRADPLFTATVKHADYRSPGQMSAVRAVSVAQSEDSIIVVLPTGSGKTEVVLTRALQERPRQTCVIVPTTSLALDLERRVRTLTGDNTLTAYHGDLTDAQKGDFLERVRSGTQWLVVTSPEAACTVLERPLLTAASEGRLAMIAIDEAHMVAEWGDAFRPAFHNLAGLRRRMLRVAPVGKRPITVM